MTTRVLLLLSILFLAGCATRAPLSSPCPPVASLTAGDCGPEKPINVASL